MFLCKRLRCTIFALLALLRCRRHNRSGLPRWSDLCVEEGAAQKFQMFGCVPMPAKCTPDQRARGAEPTTAGLGCHQRFMSVVRQTRSVGRVGRLAPHYVPRLSVKQRVAWYGFRKTTQSTRTCVVGKNRSFAVSGRFWAALCRAWHLAWFALCDTHTNRAHFIVVMISIYMSPHSQ